MAKNRDKLEPCPFCSRGEISRSIDDFSGLKDSTNGGHNVKCLICSAVLWVPLDQGQEIELVSVPSIGDGFDFLQTMAALPGAKPTLTTKGYLSVLN